MEAPWPNHTHIAGAIHTPDQIIIGGVWLEI